jgi:hypothetical protein
MPIERERNVAPRIPFVFLYATTGVTVTTTPTPLTYVTPIFINNSFKFVDGSSRLYVGRGGEGLYEITASAGIVAATGVPTRGVLTLYINGTIVLWSTAHSYIGTGQAHSDIYLHGVEYLRTGDYVEIYISVNAGTGTLEGKTARFIVKAITLVGWNNRRGGKYKYPFIEE